MPGASRDVTNLAAVEGDAVMRGLMPKDRVDRPQHRLGRAERDLERHDPPILAGLNDPLFEVPAHRQKGARIGALKTVDRLFRITDGKDRAQAIAGAFTGKELLGER